MVSYYQLGITTKIKNKDVDIMTIKNLSQMKKWAMVGSKIEIVENAIIPENNNELRTIEKVQTNAWKTIKPSGKESWLTFQKARNLRFNDDNTVEFLVGEEMSNKRMIEEMEKGGKDYWLKIKLIAQ